MDTLLLANALALGFRHGFDWDHIAAILDIVGSTRNVGASSGKTTKRNAIWIASYYALGHAMVCLILGFLAIQFHLLTPDWIDRIMEKIVGLTLLVLGAWIFISALDTSNQTPRSAWLSIFSWLQRFQNRITKRHSHKHQDLELATERYGPKTAFGVGIVHGIGAETATQILLLTAIGGASTRATGLSMLVLFVAGLILSNLFTSGLAAIGFFNTAPAKRFLLASSFLAGGFSICVGAVFVTGASALLPHLH